MAAFGQKLCRQQVVSLFPVGSCLCGHVLEQVRFPSVERPTTDLDALSSRRQTHQPSKPDSARGPLCGPGGAEARGYVLIDESGGLVSISTNYDKRLHVCGISECRCVKLTLINPFVHFSCLSGVQGPLGDTDMNVSEYLRVPCASVHSSYTVALC